VAKKAQSIAADPNRDNKVTSIMISWKYIFKSQQNNPKTHSTANSTTHWRDACLSLTASRSFQRWCCHE